jgi:pyridoxamine 5'-phosphate oxidase
MTEPDALRELLRSLPVLEGRPPQFDVSRAPASPEPLFADWLYSAILAGVPEPHAMTLSTVDESHRPNARVLLLKNIDHSGWWFATDTESVKASELASSPSAALTFYWPLVARQIRVRGTVLPADPDVSAQDFAARVPRARAVVLANAQLASTGHPYTRGDLAGAADRLEAQGNQVGAAESVAWVAFVLAPDEVEFWQADPGRLHARLCYSRDFDGSWTSRVLAH